MTRFVWPRTVLSFALVLISALASAQSLTVSGGSTKRSAIDFATHDVGDPWDFSQATDYSYMFSDDLTGLLPSFAGVPTLPNGILTGLCRTSQPNLQMQFEGLTGALNLVDRNGVRFPIDTTRYNRVSFRMRRSVNPSNPAEGIGATWFTSTAGRSANTVGGYLGISRGFDPHTLRYVNQSPVASQGATNLFHVYKLDLDRPGLQYGPTWSGIMRGLRLTLGNAPELVNSTIEVDWVRLTKRGDTTTTLSWSGFGGAVSLTATHQQTGDVIQIYPDNDTNATTFSDNSSFAWDHGFLAPGNYTITATRGGTSRQAALTIDAAPVITISDPDISGGRDYATTVLADAWDMTNQQDALRYGRVGNTGGLAFGETGVTGYNLNTDPFVQMIDDWDDVPGTEKIIDANLYHRLTFTIEYTDRKDLSAAQALSNTYGGMIRVGWRRANNNGGPYTVTEDIILMDGGPVTYSMDLSTFTSAGTGSPLDTLEVPVANYWQGQMANLRIDPNEASIARGFRVANVKLAADDMPNPYGFFTIKWNAADALLTTGLSDSGGAGSTVTLYSDTDTNPNNGKTTIASGIAASAGQYGWNLAGLAAGRYYVYIEIADGAGNAQGRYSTGPVYVASTIAPPTDNDGDGMADSWESKFGVSAAGTDSDNDGLSNVDEYRNGTNPLLSNTWTLSEGATGFFRERLALANPDTDPADVTIRYLRESGDPVVRTYTVPGLGRTTVNVNEVSGLGSAAVSAVVTANTGGVVVERTMSWDASSYGGHTGKGIARAGTQWYLAEGEANFFDTYILLANATSSAARVTVTYLLDTGATVPGLYDVAPNSRLTIHANAISSVKGHAFSTSLTSTVPITVERSMYFTNAGRLWNGGTEAAAVESPATSWFVAEGRTGPFFDMFLLLANPGTSAATATIRYLVPGGAVVTRTYTLPATSRTTVWVDNEAGLTDTDVSASITATQPIIVERAMYWPGSFSQWYEAHASAGVTSTGTKWALAEGEFGGNLNYQTWILLANPSSSAATVRMTFLRASGPPLSYDFSVPANSRLSRSAGEFPLQSGERFGVMVESLNGVPIVMERAMYWDGAGQYWGGGTNETAVRIR